MNSIAVFHADHSVAPLVLRPARFETSPGRWHAWPVRSTRQIPGGMYTSEEASSQFWAVQKQTGVPMVGTGRTTDQAIGKLRFALKEAGRTHPNPRPVIEVESLRGYTEPHSVTLDAARRYLQCAMGLDGQDYSDLISSLYRAEEIVESARLSVESE